MDVWTVLGTIVTLVGRTSGSYMHAIGKTSQKNFDKGYHSREEREEYYDRVYQTHKFADMTEDTICGFGEKIKSKSKKKMFERKNNYVRERMAHMQMSVLWK